VTRGRAQGRATPAGTSASGGRSGLCREAARRGIGTAGGLVVFPVTGTTDGYVNINRGRPVSVDRSGREVRCL
jgi:hypothetical protein